MIFFFLILEEMIRTTKIYIAVTRLIVVGLAKQGRLGVVKGWRKESVSRGVSGNWVNWTECQPNPTQLASFLYTLLMPARKSVLSCLSLSLYLWPPAFGITITTTNNNTDLPIPFYILIIIFCPLKDLCCLCSHLHFKMMTF
jgi:hypothetical protein